MYEREVSLESMRALAAVPPECLGLQICEVSKRVTFYLFVCLVFKTFFFLNFVLFLKDPAIPLKLPRWGFEALTVGNRSFITDCSETEILNHQLVLVRTDGLFSHLVKQTLVVGLQFSWWSSGCERTDDPLIHKERPPRRLQLMERGDGSM